MFLMSRLLLVGAAGVRPALCSLRSVYIVILLIVSVGKDGGVRNVINSLKVGL